MERRQDYLLTDLVMEYLAQRPDLEGSTVDHTRRAWRHLIRCVGDIAAASFNREHAERYRTDLLRRYQPATAVSYIKTVRPAFRWLASQASNFVDPFAGLRRIRVGRQRPKTLNRDQICAWMAAAESLVDQIKIAIANTTGARRGEIQNLTWADVDCEQLLIHIQPKAETASTWRWRPKDGDYRTVPMTEMVRDLLYRRRMEIPQSQPYVCLTEKRYSYLQWRRGRGEMSDRQRRCPDENAKPLRRAREKAGAAKASLRRLRSTCLTRLATKLPLHAVSELAGHSSVETTRCYYIASDPSYIDKARAIGATGLEPATS